MNEEMKETVEKLMAEGKGILAMDESLATCTKMFEKVGLTSTPASREEYREMIVTPSGLGNFISGAILFDETIRQSPGGTPFPKILEGQGIIPGIKVDKGTVELSENSEEKLTIGLEGLGERLSEYKSLGARFAKWRAIIEIDGEKNFPSDECIGKNSEALAKYASLCQEQGIVPIVEPEVLMNGKHNIEKSYEVTSKVLRNVFDELEKHKVFLPGTILKPNMVLSGYESGEDADSAKVAEMTLKCLNENVPKEVGGVAFLSGGQSDEMATENLNEIVKLSRGKSSWPITFSYGRGLQRGALSIWAKTKDREKAQQAILARAEENSRASRGIL